MTHSEIKPQWWSAAPFAVGYLLVPTTVFSVIQGGFWLALTPILAWNVSALIDQFTGRVFKNYDPNTPHSDLAWYQNIVRFWTLLQLALIAWTIGYVAGATHLSLVEKAFAMLALGICSGAIGIVFAHELMHQKSRLDRFCADILMASVLYSHFRSEHLLVHHRYVGTARDPVTARFNEGFWRFFIRVVPACLFSAFSAEAGRLAKIQKKAWDFANPFWYYALLQGAFLCAAFLLGGWIGVGLFILQAMIAILHLELVNYVEHYGLTRAYLGDNKYEHVQTHHSWNTDHQFTNLLLINLQRHSDHHYKPDRPYPLLQTYGPNEAPRFPYSYPLMIIMAIHPPIWRRVMNKRVAAWRARHYPDITDWEPYNNAALPLPR